MTAAPGSGAMFDRIAPRYDALNRVLSLGIDRSWRRRAADALVLRANATVLDIATGTGDLAIAIAKRWPTATVIGVDPSPGMLAVGRAKLFRSGLADRVALREGNAMDLDFDDDAVDAVTIGFGLRNVPDRSRGLAEMARVVRPGGRVVVLELGEPRLGRLAPLARFHIHRVVPWLGALASGAPEYRYLERSIAAFPPPDEVAAMMSGAGIDVIAIDELMFGACHVFVGRVRGDRADRT